MKCKNCNKEEAETMWFIYEVCWKCYSFLKNKSNDARVGKVGPNS